VSRGLGIYITLPTPAREISKADGNDVDVSGGSTENMVKRNVNIIKYRGAGRGRIS
jgi:hypothetical protein